MGILHDSILASQIAEHNLKNKLGPIEFGNYNLNTTKNTYEDRLSILQEREREGQANIIRKYHLAHSVYLRCKSKSPNEGIYGLKDKHKIVDPELQALENENERLTEIKVKQDL